MNNSYSDSTSASIVEYCTALEDFVYGESVKLSVPSLNLMSNNSISENKQRINTNNIMNKDKSKLIVENKTVTMSNYLSIIIPIELYRYKNECGKKLTYKGFKGESFALSFIGGDLTKPIVLRRID